MRKLFHLAGNSITARFLSFIVHEFVVVVVVNIDKGTVIPAITMFIVSQLDPQQKYLIIALIALGFGCLEVALMGGFSFVLVDIAPQYIGVLQGISKTIGLAPGFIMPMVMAALTTNVSFDF